MRKKSMLRLREKIRAKTRRTSGQSLARVIASLNPMLKGWYNYFKHATSGLKDVDAFTRRRLRAMLRKQEKRPGCGNCKDDRIRWPNKFFATAGLFTLDTAWRQADSPDDQETIDWRAVCGKTAVRFGGRGGQKPSLPLSGATARGPWIASSQGLLAMTVNGGVRVPRVDFLVLGFALSPAATESPPAMRAAAARRGGAASLPLSTSRWRTGRPEEFLVS